jgi:pimeloyl-ACP methyl ester carboxylesterase
VDIFASSGGAVNALALVARHPEQVRVLVAHEPPAAQVLPDREAMLAAFDGIRETYLREGFGALRAASTRVVLGVGAQSSQAAAGRAAVAIAERLGTEPVIFPGGHDGFIGGEYGGMGEPGAFAATLPRSSPADGPPGLLLQGSHAQASRGRVPAASGSCRRCSGPRPEPGFAAAGSAREVGDDCEHVVDDLRQRGNSGHARSGAPEQPSRYRPPRSRCLQLVPRGHGTFPSALRIWSFLLELCEPFEELIETCGGFGLSWMLADVH